MYVDKKCSKKLVVISWDWDSSNLENKDKVLTYPGTTHKAGHTVSPQIRVTEQLWLDCEPQRTAGEVGSWGAMPAFLLYPASELRVTRILVWALGPLLKRRCLHSLLSLRRGCFPLGFVLKRQRFRPGHPSWVRRGILTLHPSSSSPVSTCHMRKVVVGVSAHRLCPGDTVGVGSLELLFQAACRDISAGGSPLPCCSAGPITLLEDLPF